MDTITHGIAGALIGKAFFTGRAGEGEDRDSRGSAAVWCVALGAVFPDSDSLLDFLDPTSMAVITEHRGATHSLLLLPLWALGLAFVTRAVVRGRGLVDPAGRLALAYAAGILSHIVLDLINSWGTMIWMPVARTRVAWDLAFVIDFTLTAVALLPQVAAWVYGRRAGSFARRLGAWALFSLGAAGVERVARHAGFPFSPWAVVGASLLFALLLFLPARKGWGFGVSRAAWCRAGFAALVVYLGMCWLAHRAAEARVAAFARRAQIPVERLGALPLPPAVTHWSGLLRTPQGVYEARFSLLDAALPEFRFIADAPANPYIEAARREPLVQSFLWFARFPVVRYLESAAPGGLRVVEFADLRFFSRGVRRRHPFTFRVTLDAAGRVVQAGWRD